MIIHGDSRNELEHLDSDSADFVCTDPPYGYSFMGKDWDRAVPSVEIWQQCLRVLKPGAFMCVMSAPRSDVQNAMISRLMEAGFRLDFTPIYWTYASGFPKAGNIGKLVDKRKGAEREVTGLKMRPDGKTALSARQGIETGRIAYNRPAHSDPAWIERNAQTTAPATPQAKALDGSYAGFQPKPAVEVIIVAMKPLSEKTYVDQALSNGHGVSWLDDGRIPTGEDMARANGGTDALSWGGTYGAGKNEAHQRKEQGLPAQGRFPANLLVSDDVLNDGTITGEPKRVEQVNKSHWGGSNNSFKGVRGHGDSGSYSRYFDLDKWSQTLPFLICPKAAKSEKNKGLEDFTPTKTNDGRAKEIDNAFQRGSTLRNNHHPTVKPLKLMSYLISLFSRPGDTVLDPFCGSGSTNVAAHNLGRETIGIEREAEYVEIARARLAHVKPEVPQLPPEVPSPGVPPQTLEAVTEALDTPQQISLL